LVRLQEFVACACDVATALQIIESRTREQAAAVTRRTAAAVNPLTWHGEITAANAESVWKFTWAHINSLCGGWKTDSSNGQTKSDGSFMAPTNAEPHPVLDALKMRILTPPTLPRRKLIIDLSSVRFIDSTGLGLMVRAKKLVAGHGAHMVFTGVQPTVRNVIRIARLEDYLLGDTLSVPNNLDKAAVAA
jgi:anti-anti-sigma factor